MTKETRILSLEHFTGMFRFLLHPKETALEIVGRVEVTRSFWSVIFSSKALVHCLLCWV